MTTTDHQKDTLLSLVWTCKVCETDFDIPLDQADLGDGCCSDLCSAIEPEFDPAMDIIFLNTTGGHHGEKK